MIIIGIVGCKNVYGAFPVKTNPQRNSDLMALCLTIKVSSDCIILIVLKTI